jgi:hypothetical protein
MKLTELNKIFLVEYGNKFDRNKMALATKVETAVAFVGRSGNMNGVTAFVEPLDDIPPHASGYITTALGGAILSSFVQSRPFYTAQNVAVLVPPSDMSLAEKLYYCLCIQQNRHRYGAFGREANRTLRTLAVPTRSSVPKWVASVIDGVSADWKAEVAGILKAVK